MTKLDTFNLYESNVRSYCRSYPTIFERAKGSCLYDTEGDRYIDFLSGAGTLNYGHNDDGIIDSVLDYLKKDGVLMGLDLHTRAKEMFIETFQKNILQPRKLDYKLQFTSPTGTSVVESAIKLARKHSGRNNVIAFTNAFHGMSGNSLSLTGSRHNRQSFCDGANVSRMPYDSYLGENVDTISYLKKLLLDQSSGIDLPAAVILESVQAEGGLNVASVKWLSALSVLCRENNILLIVDDIQAGCGRTGSFFSFERANIKPDMVCLSKSLGGCGLPFALLLINPNLDIWSPGEDNGTFRGNNLAFVASTEMLKRYWRDNKFERKIKLKSELVISSLDKMASLHPGMIIRRKGIGLMQGLEFRDPSHVKVVKEQCFQDKLIVETCGDSDQVLKLMPALNISEEILFEGLDIVSRAIAITASQFFAQVSPTYDEPQLRVM